MNVVTAYHAFVGFQEAALTLGIIGEADSDVAASHGSGHWFYEVATPEQPNRTLFCTLFVDESTRAVAFSIDVREFGEPVPSLGEVSTERPTAAVMAGLLAWAYASARHGVALCAPSA